MIKQNFKIILDGEYIHMKCGVALICRQWAITSGDCARELKYGDKYVHKVKFGNMRWDQQNKHQEELFIDQIIGMFFNHR